MLTALPLDCCGEDDGAWMLVELLLLLVESLLFDVPVLVEPVLALELLAEEPVLDEPGLDELVLAAACVAPGSRIAITPATAALLSPTAAVVTFSR
ncbi:MAG: hypothetical protein ACRDN0_15305 [Trebonia sp.]